MVFTKNETSLVCAADAICHILDQEWATTNDLRRLTKWSNSTVSRYRNGESEPSFDDVCLIVQGHPDQRVRTIFPSMMVRGTPAVVAYCDSSFDVNGDGKVDGDDAVVAMSRMLSRAATELEKLMSKLKMVQPGRRGQRSLFLTLSAAEVLGFQSEVDQIVCDVMTAQRVVNFLAEQAARMGVRG